MGMDGVVSWLEATPVALPIARWQLTGDTALGAGPHTVAGPRRLIRLPLPPIHDEVLPQGTPGAARAASLDGPDGQGLKRPKSSGFRLLR